MRCHAIQRYCILGYELPTYIDGLVGSWAKFEDLTLWIYTSLLGSVST